MEQDNQGGNVCSDDTSQSWHMETRELAEALISRLTHKERQLNDRERRLDAEGSRLKRLQDEVCNTFNTSAQFALRFKTYHIASRSRLVRKKGLES